MEIKCKECGHSEVPETYKDRLKSIVELSTCRACGGEMRPVIISSEYVTQNFTVDDIEWFKQQRLLLHEKKAIDMGLVTKIENDELFLKGSSTAIEFFKQMCDVYTVSQLIGYDVSMKFLRMLENVPYRLYNSEYGTIKETAMKLNLTNNELAQLLFTKI